MKLLVATLLLIAGACASTHPDPDRDRPDLTGESGAAPTLKPGECWADSDCEPTGGPIACSLNVAGTVREGARRVDTCTVDADCARGRCASTLNGRACLTRPGVCVNPTMIQRASPMPKRAPTM